MNTRAEPALILVIDDDPDTRETFQWMLSAEGYAVRVAATVEAGVHHAVTCSPHAIFLDLRLPRIGGLQCLRQLRASPATSSVPVAILTGDYFVDEETAGEVDQLGARIYFKPIWEEDLRRILAEVQNHRRPAAE